MTTAVDGNATGRAAGTQAREWVKWMHEYLWSRWVTLTVGPSECRGWRTRGFRGGPAFAERQRVHRRKRLVSLGTSTGLVSAFKEEFVRFYEKAAQQRVSYVYVVEAGALGDHLHIHALLYCAVDVDCRRLAKAWRYGRATVDVYDPTRGAAFYLGEKIGRGAHGYDISKRMPPRLDASRPVEVKG